MMKKKAEEEKEESGCTSVLATTPIDGKTCSKRKMEQNCHLLSKEEEEEKNYTKTGDNKLDNTFGFQTYYYYYVYYYYYYVFYYEQQSKKKKLTTNSIYYDGSGKYSLSCGLTISNWMAHREYEL